MVISAIRVLKVTQIATCSAPAATVIDSENDDAFFGPIASWFVLIDDRFQNETDSKHRNSLFAQCIIINKYIDGTTLTFRCITSI